MKFYVYSCGMLIFLLCFASTAFADPEIGVLDPSSSDFLSGEYYVFGEVLVNGSSQVQFTIENPASSSNNLNIGTITKSGASSSKFAITQPASSSIAPGSSTTFSIAFNPTSAGVVGACISIPSDATNVNPFEINVYGIGVEPEINIKQGANDIASGTGSYDCGDVLVNEYSNDIVFTVQNIGTSVLSLSGSPVIQISGADSSMFSIDQTGISSTIAVNTSTVFSVTFCPTSIGTKQATISIANDDNDENPYTFQITGEGISPEINVKQNTTNIPSGTGLYNFGTVLVGNSSSYIDFIIENSGSANLQLLGLPKIGKSGTDAAMFTIYEGSTYTPILPTNQTTFRIKFTPTSQGIKTATISIANNDLDENPYTFTVSGTGEVATRSDFNGDGIDDVIVGAMMDDDGGNMSGCAFIFFGSTTPSSQINASNADVKIVGEWGGNLTGDRLGCSVSSIGDFNNDGFDDFIVGAFGNSGNGSDSGSAYIFLGKSNPPSVIDASNADIKINGSQTSVEYFGWSVSGAGDVNNDGFDDVIVGGPISCEGGSDAGVAFIFFGCQTPPSILYAPTANVKLVGADAGDHFGYSVNNAGDVNNDGFDDVIIGAYRDDDGGTDAGCAFIFYGSNNMPSTIDASNANVKLIGEEENDFFGQCVSGIGRFNDDDYDDIIVGAPYNDENGNRSGRAYIFFGGANLPSGINASNANVTITGLDAYDYCGWSVSDAGDVNGDDYDDVIVGARGDDEGGNEAGCAYIYYGSASPPQSIVAENSNVKLIGDRAHGAYLGSSVSNAGDFNGDGKADVIVGGEWCYDTIAHQGAALLLFGNLSGDIQYANANVKMYGTSSTDRFGSSVGGTEEHD